MNTHSAQTRAKLGLIASMLIFGTIGIFVRHIPLPSAIIAFARGVIGMLFLLLVIRLRGGRISFTAIRANLLPLCLSGAFLGINWILLFEAYRYTTVATATLCYYMAPILVMLISPLLGERLSGRKLFCVVGALMGMVFVSGVLQTGIHAMQEIKGILLGLSAAVFYASVVLLNKKIRDISAYDKTVVQLGVSALVLVPYLALTAGGIQAEVTPMVIGLLVLTGILHTGIAYTLYFGSMKDLKAQTVAILSYIDPISAIVLSAVFLGESMTVYGMIGAGLVLGSAFVSELPEK